MGGNSESRRVSTMSIENQEFPVGAPAPAKKKFAPKALSEEDALLKDIKIKSGICKRCAKELVMYKKENDKLQAVVTKLEEEGACEHDIKKQQEVLEENLNIIPSAISRLQQAYDNLCVLLDENDESAEASEACREGFAAARAVLKDAEECEELEQ